MKKLYPDSGIELNPVIARHYDSIINFVSMGLYRNFIQRAIKDVKVRPGDSILDLGCGTGRNALLMARDLTSGYVVGMDVSPIMEKQFMKKAQKEPKLKFVQKRIDQPFDLGQFFDKVFISFVIHGLPHDIRKTVIRNAYSHLKPGGSFFILDYAEFNMKEMPLMHRFVFASVECKYAFDFIRYDWKNILKNHGFGTFSEHFYAHKYVRLLEVVKTG